MTKNSKKFKYSMFLSIFNAYEFEYFSCAKLSHYGTLGQSQGRCHHHTKSTYSQGQKDLTSRPGSLRARQTPRSTRAGDSSDETHRGRASRSGCSGQMVEKSGQALLWLQAPHSGRCRWADTRSESFAHAMEKGELVVLLPYASTILVQHGLQEKHPTDFLQWSLHSTTHTQA